MRNDLDDLDEIGGDQSFPV